MINTLIKLTKYYELKINMFLIIRMIHNISITVKFRFPFPKAKTVPKRCHHGTLDAKKACTHGRTGC